MGSAGTVGDLLASRRRRRFVGRASEIELFRAALDSAEPPFSVLHVHGPPGIGKTSLLDVLAGLSADAGASVVRLDGRDLVPSPPAVLAALREVLQVPEGTPVAWIPRATASWSSWPMATRWGCRCWPMWSSAAARRPPIP
jgi:hypothetical protein